MNKRFLVPVLALAGFGLPVGASILEYCSGLGCGASTQSAFTNDVATDGYTFQGLQTFVLSSVSGNTYNDTTAGLVFTDLGVGPSTGQSGDFSIAGTALSSSSGDYVITITIPATYLAISLDVNVPQHLCANDCPEGQTSGFIGFINTGSPTSPWTISISPLSNGGITAINSFNVASSAGTGGETPEVGTLLLIGSGLIAMRWMRRWPRRRVFRVPQTA